MKLWRSIEDWEWYNDVPCRLLFMHCLVKVNRLPGTFQGEPIAPGEWPTSLPKMALGAGISEQQVRTAINKLRSTGDIRDRSTGAFRVVSVCNWEHWQGSTSDDQQASNSQTAGGSTADQQQNNDRIYPIGESKKRRRGEGKKLSPIGERGARTPEQIEEVRNAFKAACKVVTDADPSRLVEKERKGFFAYWTETNAKGKMRFEWEKVFEHGRRMDTWMANANKRKDGGLFNGNGSTTYGKAEAEAEMAAIREKNGRDPQWGPVYDSEMSAELIAYNKALLRTTK